MTYRRDCGPQITPLTTGSTILTNNLATLDTHNSLGQILPDRTLHWFHAVHASHTCWVRYKQTQLLPSRRFTHFQHHRQHGNSKTSTMRKTKKKQKTDGYPCPSRNGATYAGISVSHKISHFKKRLKNKATASTRSLRQLATHGNAQVNMYSVRLVLGLLQPPSSLPSIDTCSIA